MLWTVWGSLGGTTSKGLALSRRWRSTTIEVAYWLWITRSERFAKSGSRFETKVCHKNRYTWSDKTKGDLKDVGEGN